MTAITTPAIGTAVEDSPTTTVSSVPYPATDAGDAMVLCVAINSVDAVSVDTDGALLAGGWRKVDQRSYNGSTQSPGHAVWVKTATGSETGNLSVAHSALAASMQILAFPNADADLITVVDFEDLSGTTATPTLQGTVDATGSALVILTSANSQTIDATPPTGFTETADRVAATRRSWEVAYKLGATAGDSGALVTTYSGSTRFTGVLIEVPEFAAAPPPPSDAVGTPRAAAMVSGTTTPTNVPFPAVVNVGDLLLLAVSQQVPSGVGSVTTPTGWTLLTPPGFMVANAGTGTPALAVYWKWADGTEDGTNLSVAHTSTTNNFSAQIIAVPDVDPTTPFDVTTTSVDGAVALTCVIPSQTIATDGAAQITFSANNSTTGTATPPSGMTELGDQPATTKSLETAYITGLAPGASGTRTVTWSTSARTLGIAIALRPVSGGGGAPGDSGIFRIGTGGTLIPVEATRLV